MPYFQLPKQGYRNKVINELNITPLVDVILVLLIIFMITTPIMMSKININLPTSQSRSTINTSDNTLIISINSYGQIYIFDTMVSKQEFSAKVKAIISEKPDQNIIIKGDRNISYGKIVEVINMLNMEGFHKISLMTSMKSHSGTDAIK